MLDGMEWLNGARNGLHRRQDDRKQINDSLQWQYNARFYEL